MKRSKQDKQVIKDEADATERYEHPTGATGQNVGDIGHTEVGKTAAPLIGGSAGGATGTPVPDQPYHQNDTDGAPEVESKPSWFDRTFRSSEGQ